LLEAESVGGATTEMVVVADVGQLSLVVIEAVTVIMPDELPAGEKDAVGLAELLAKRAAGSQLTLLTPPPVMEAVKLTLLPVVLQTAVEPLITAAVG
jgi:hypothetical protein